MGAVNWLAVVLATFAFFAVGAVWFGMLFSKAWQRETGVREPVHGVARTMGLTLLGEFIMVLMLAHLYARTDPTLHVKLMMALGFGLAIIAPAIGINYLHQGRSMRLFLIEVGHFAVGLLVAALVLNLLG
jgi:hypothetical protein